MQIKLIRMALINFKGVRNQTFNFSPNLNLISGDNGTGKTSILDGFLWTLFGKDSTDRKDFEIKTLDKNNKVIERIDHEVELTLEVDFKEVTLKRVLREKWTKPKGQEDEVFSGNETHYFWNDVPMKQSDFTAKINTMIDEGLFKLLTNVMFFHTLHWEKRREILFSMAGQISDQDILDRNAGLFNKDHSMLITNILNQGKTLAEAKAEISNKKSRIKEELKFIPARIDEAERSKPAKVDIADINKQTQSLKDEVKSKQADLENTIKAESDYSEKLNLANKAYNTELDKYYALKSKATNLIHVIESEVRAANQGNSAEIQRLQNEFNRSTTELTSLTQRIDKLNTNIANSQSLVQSKRDQWNEENAKVMPEFDVNSCKCPTCLQDLPESDVLSRKDEFVKNFNQNKSAKLSTIQSEGKDEAAKLEDSTVLLADLEKEINDLSNNREATRLKIDDLVSEDSNREPLDNLIDLAKANHEELNKLIAEGTLLKNQLDANKPETDNSGNDLFIKRQELQTDINVLQGKINEIERKLGDNTIIENIDKRILELTDQESKLSGELNDLEHKEFAILQFEKQRVSFIESRINDKFGFVTFKMFETQINGSEIPCCKTLINGVPFEDANTASKINAGLDVINALSNHHNIYAPVFIDNAEAVNNYIDTKSQVIRLNVSKDKELVFKNELQTA